MVTKEQIQKEFDMFQDYWGLIKGTLPVENKSNEPYWDDTFDKLAKFWEKNNNEFAKSLGLAWVEELERRSKQL